MLGGYKMAAFNTIEEALEDLRRGKFSFSTFLQVVYLLPDVREC